MRILIIGADTVSNQAISTMLSSGGFAADAVTSGDEGVDMASIYDYDLIALDMNVEGMAANEVLRQLRSNCNLTPVIAMSVSSVVGTRVGALTAGADDFMAKPFHRDELVARVNAVVRRSRGHASSVIEIDGIVLDLTARTVHIDEQRIHLTSREYQIVEVLILRRETTMSKEMLLNHLYGGCDAPEIKVIDVFVCKIRKKIAEATGGRDVIETVWGRGYALARGEVKTRAA